MVLSILGMVMQLGFWTQWNEIHFWMDGSKESLENNWRFELDNWRLNWTSRRANRTTGYPTIPWGVGMSGPWNVCMGSITKLRAAFWTREPGLLFFLELVHQWLTEIAHRFWKTIVYSRLFSRFNMLCTSRDAGHLGTLLSAWKAL